MRPVACSHRGWAKLPLKPASHSSVLLRTQAARVRFMNKSTRSPRVSGDWVSDDAPLTAESLQNDFNGLIAIFDRHLAALSADDIQARKHIAQAKAAAE